MPWTRASELDRTLICPGSLIMPRDPAKSEKALEAADWGVMVHHWIETGEIRPEAGRDRHAKLFEERVKYCDRTALWPAGGRHEISVAYCPATTKIFHSEVRGRAAQEEWKAQWGPEYLTGTMDYWGTVMGDPWVDDFKSGAWEVSVYTWQLEFYVLAAWLLSGEPDGGARGSITQWPRYPKTGTPVRTGRHMTPTQLWAFDEFLISRQNHAEEARAADDIVPFLTPGDHCTFCPSRGVCPARGPH